MACAYAKFSGELGVCLSTGGPGATHLITGLYDAKLDHTPVLAITGQASRSVRGAHYQQELNLDRVFADVADYVQEGTTPQQVGVILDRAIRTAKAATRSPRWSCRTTSPDSPYEEPARAHGYTRSGRRLCAAARRAARGRPAPRRRGAERGQEGRDARRRRRPAGDRRSDRGRRPAAGRRGEGAARQGSAARRPAVGDRHDRPARLEAFVRPDGRLRHAADGRHRFPVVASSCPRPARRARCRSTSIRRCSASAIPTEVNLHGDSAETLRALLPLLEQKTDTALARRHRQGLDDWWELMGKRAPCGRQSGQPAARDLGALAAAAVRRDRHLRFGQLRELVRPRPAHPARHDVLAFGRPGVDGRRGAVRDRRQVRASRTGR